MYNIHLNHRSNLLNLPSNLLKTTLLTNFLNQIELIFTINGDGCSLIILNYSDCELNYKLIILLTRPETFHEKCSGIIFNFAGQKNESENRKFV